jgi:hypothetical protein
VQLERDPAAPASAREIEQLLDEATHPIGARADPHREAGTAAIVDRPAQQARCHANGRERIA